MFNFSPIPKQSSIHNVKSSHQSKSPVQLMSDSTSSPMNSESISTPAKEEHQNSREKQIQDLKAKRELKRKIMKKLSMFVGEMKNTIVKRCTSNLDICSLIGSEQKSLSIYMKYCTFQYLSSGKGILENTNNGFNFLLTYTRDFNTKRNKQPRMVQSSCVLKSSRPPEANLADPDNLFYEYMVGNWLNDKINENFPFFICTHGLYFYKSDTEYNKMRNLFNTNQIINQNNKNVINESLELKHSNGKKMTQQEYISNLRMSYIHPRKMCILIEGVPNPNTLWNVLKKRNVSFYEKDLIPVLFQIYGALHKLRNQFTHHDLHYSNVLLTHLPDYYFSYYFNTGNNVYNVHCKYLVKIIDYGRCYFEGCERLDKDLCTHIPEIKHKRLCNENYNDNYGMNGYNLRIYYSKYNKSADLFCLHEVIRYGRITRLLDYSRGLEEYANKLEWSDKMVFL